MVDSLDLQAQVPFRASLLSLEIRILYLMATFFPWSRVVRFYLLRIATNKSIIRF